MKGEELMSCNTLAVLMPVLWAVVATGIGLALYKSSSALFMNSRKTEGEQRQIRLTGSVTIAALAFYGMKMATSAELLLPVRPGFAKVEISGLMQLHEMTVKLDRTALDLQACIATVVDSVCKGKAATLKQDINSLTQSTAKLLPGN